MSVRYVAREKVCESFVGFFELDEGVTGEAIATVIEKAIADCHLDPFKIRGQALMEQVTCQGSTRAVRPFCKENTHRLFILIVVPMF